jgi:hypothetical protein
MNVYSDFTIPAFGRHVTVLTFRKQGRFDEVYTMKLG